MAQEEGGESRELSQVIKNVDPKVKTVQSITGTNNIQSKPRRPDGREVGRYEGGERARRERMPLVLRRHVAEGEIEESEKAGRLGRDGCEGGVQKWASQEVRVEKSASPRRSCNEGNRSEESQRAESPERGAARRSKKREESGKRKGWGNARNGNWTKAERTTDKEHTEQPPGKRKKAAANEEEKRRTPARREGKREKKAKVCGNGVHRSTTRGSLKELRLHSSWSEP